MVREGQFVIREGETANHIFFLKEGTCSVEKNIEIESGQLSE